ncbi:response regulator transcription factor [Paenibacillus aurantius]|uniref:Response regulator transcription factor n=1 Tax=Paenibacillus aurantius TaxID=2918900 RepID=A0AA96LCI7_9BACL|nr:response regulator transcription factor [Paenibacillus aurantius]WNQ11212.1 response regulator transcription factor [Paenibacillus aurantius]
MWKIVLVDDDRQALQGMQRMIPWRELNLEPVGEAMDGEEGLRLIREHAPDIVITDIYMPVMNGLDMIEQLRREDFAGRIVILSGYADFEYARQALRLSVDDYLSKPVTLQTIREVLEKAIAELEAASRQRLEEHELRQKLMLYEPFVANEWLKAVVTGCGKGPEAGEPPPGEGPDWGASRFLVLAVEMIRGDRMEGWSARDWNLVRFAIGNISRELARELGVGAHFLELHSHHMALLLDVSRAVSDERFRELALRLAERLIASAETYLRIRLQIGAGLGKHDWRRIADSTEEAFLALEDKRCAPDTTLRVYCAKQREDREEAETGFRPVRFYQEMAEAVRQLSEVQAEAALDRFFSELSARKAVSAAELRHIGEELLAILKYTLYDSGLGLDEAFADPDVLRELQEVSLAEELKAWVLTKVKDVCDRFSRTDNLKHKQAVDFMVRYIHEHYAEDIRLSDLAEKVYLSRNYLSNIFRDATGETFNDYLTRVRMEKAKSLILERKLLVFEIAEKVGYKNVPYFTTLFKKHTGRSPSDFSKG